MFQKIAPFNFLNNREKINRFDNFWCSTPLRNMKVMHWPSSISCCQITFCTPPPQDRAAICGWGGHICIFQLSSLLGILRTKIVTVACFSSSYSKNKGETSFEARRMMLQWHRTLSTAVHSASEMRRTYHSCCGRRRQLLNETRSSTSVDRAATDWLNCSLRLMSSRVSRGL